MIELYLAIGLMSLGYLFNEKKPRQNKIIKPKKKIQEKNIYEPNLKPQVDNIENELINKINKETKNSNETIAPYYNRAVINNSNKKQAYQQNPDKDINITSKLTGKVMKKEEFTHNNMVPFFGGTIRQNTDENASKNILERFTGRSEFDKHKKEQAPLFKPTKDLTNINGSKNVDLKNRYNASRYVKTELPFTQVMVASGVGQDYGKNGKGGFHQFEINELVKPKNIDELRSLSNPKLTYKGRVISGKDISRRGKMGDMKKNRPETFYHNSPERYLKTTGAVLKSKQRERFCAKATNRQNTRSYQGNAAPAVNKKPRKIPLHKKSTKNLYKTDTTRNVKLVNQWNAESKNSDYGKSSFNLPCNERDVTQKRTHINNLVTNVKALIAPLEDVMKRTRKENTIGNSRPEGNISMPIPDKLKVYDPNDIAKTTIKETLIHNEHEGHLQGPSRLQVYDPNDVAKTTIKETTIDNERDGHLSGPNRLTVYDPNDVMRTTIKETNIDNEREGHLQGPKRLTVYDPNDIAKTTIKETLIHDNRTGNFNLPNKTKLYQQDEARVTTRNTIEPIDYNKNSRPNQPYKRTAHDENDVPKTTMKETTEHNENQVGNMGYQNDNGYLIDPAEAPATQKQFLSDHEYTGQADGDVGRGGGEGYLTSNYEAPNTQKQFTSDYEYSGIAGSVDDKPMSYADKYNARLNINREKISRGRAPTQTGVKVMSGQETVNISHKKQMSATNLRPNDKTRVIQNIRGKESYDLTSFKDSLSNEVIQNRIEPKLLDSFKKNPYTQPLDSYGCM